MIKNRGNLLTNAAAAEILGFSEDHVRRLVREGKIKGQKVGGIWLIYEKDLAKIKRQRKKFFRKREKGIHGSGDQ